MANAALPLLSLSHIALAAGIDMGFNAAGAKFWVDAETSEPRIAITWGDREQMRNIQPRGCYYALSYDECESCIRSEKTIEFPDSIRFEASYDLQSRFTQALMELV